MNMYPKSHSTVNSLQSKLFGHRLKPSQTKYEYLIEFLQVAIAKKENAITARPYSDMFPVSKDIEMDNITYYPETRIGLKRFVFLPKSKLDGKAEVDKKAYQACIKALEQNVVGGNSIAKHNCILIIQNLMNGFSAVNQSRSWFDQNMLPICPEVILPEGMGVKSWRQKLDFKVGEADVDYRFDYHKYTYMCRGGEIYYLHLLNAINEHPEYKLLVENRLREMVSCFPQFSYLCDFVQKTWDDYVLIPYEDRESKKLSKDLGAIPLIYANRNGYTLSELSNFLESNSHPFEKMEALANGIILQMMRMMYSAASTQSDSNCWVVDINYKGIESVETKKVATSAFRHNEEVISNYLYKGLIELVNEVSGDDEQKIINAAADDSYRLFRKMGKMIGIVIPNTGTSMRFSLSEEIIKFLVLAIIPPQKMVTLDEFIELLYQHFGMIISQEQYKKEMRRGSLKIINDLSFLDENKKAFAQKLKDCGFLRDLSDATSIVENPYESEAKLV